MSKWPCKCYKSSYTHLLNTVYLLDLRGRYMSCISKQTETRLNKDLVV